MNVRELNEKLSSHLDNSFSHTKVTDLAEQFSKNGFVMLSEIVPEEIRQAITNEVNDLIQKFIERRDLLLQTTGNTPRHMSVVKSEFIAAKSQLIPELSKSTLLLDFLKRITKEKLYTSVSKDEEYLITKQEKQGDTHGWHWGDYSFAMIWIIDTPPIENGGMLQCVPHTSWDKKNPNIHKYLCENDIQTYGFIPGDIYLLRSDTTLHRTVPLTKDATRIILNMTWASAKDLNQELIGEDRWWQNHDVEAAQQVTMA